MFSRYVYRCDGLFSRWMCVLPLLALCFLTIVGCGDDDPAKVSEPIVPVMDLAVGNTWHYYSRVNEPGAPVVDVFRTVVSHLQVFSEGDSIVVAHERVVTKAHKALLPGNSRLLRNEADGLYCYGFVDEEGAVQARNKYLVAPIGAEKGDSFPVGPDMFLVCVATDSLVATGFGEVAADVFIYSLFEGTVHVPDVFVVPGVGLTRYYSIEVTEELVGYDFD